MEENEFKIEEYTGKVEDLVELGNSWIDQRIMSFGLDAEQMVKLKAWREGLWEKKLSLSKEAFPDIPDFLHPYTGCGGGSGESFTFIPGGLGTTVKVKDSFTGEVLDLTDYEDW